MSDRLILREIILGPRCDEPISDIRESVHSLGKRIRVSKARIAFQKFKVVEDNRREFRRRTALEPDAQGPSGEVTDGPLD